MGIGVGLGLADFPFSNATAFWRWVDLCEQGDVDSIWQTDRLVSNYPILECMSVMAALAGATKRIKFGMNVASVGLRDPLVTAKQCATIDVLSDGRILPAFGVGSPIAPEWEATGRSFKGAGAKAEEAMTIISRLWSEDSVTFAGQHFHYTDAKITPRPVQKPLPLWVGGSSKAAVRRTAMIGTGWQAGQETPEQVAPVVVAIKEAAAAEGRPMDPDHFGSGFAIRFGSWDEPLMVKKAEAFQKRFKRDPKTSMVVGTADDVLARIRQYADAGISKFILRPTGADDDDIMAQTRRLVDEVIPAVDAMNAARKAAAE